MEEAPSAPESSESPQASPERPQWQRQRWRERERGGKLEREERVHPLLSSLGPWAKAEVCPRPLGLLSHNPVGISGYRHRVLDRGLWPPAFSALLWHCPLDVPSSPAVSPKSHLPGTFCILSFTLHAPSVRLELSPFYRRGN